MNRVKEVESELQHRCEQLPFRLICCDNISAEHRGHAAAHAHSHFKLIFEGHFKNSKERLEAHKTIMQAVAPLIESGTIHSVVLQFETL